MSLVQLRESGRTLRVQVPNNHILTQNLYYNYYYPKPKYLIIGYMDPLGNRRGFRVEIEVETVSVADGLKSGDWVWHLAFSVLDAGALLFPQT